MAELNAYKRKRQMKRLSAVLVVLVMLGMCTSSYGYFLIYNLSGRIKGTDGTVDVKKVTIPFKGFLVMNFDDDTNSLVDANMIIYGKNQNRHKVYVQLNAHDSNEFLDTAVLKQDVRNFYSLNGESPFGFGSLIMGNVHRRTIGRDIVGHALRKDIAPDLSGVITQEEGIFFALDEDVAGVGRISASLYGVATRGVNNPRNYVAPHTQEGIIDTLKIMVAEKHCKAVSIPALK
jgi:hypothetical protein